MVQLKFSDNATYVGYEAFSNFPNSETDGVDLFRGCETIRGCGEPS